MSGTPLFAFERVTVGSPEAPRLCDVDADVPDGGLTAVVGPSGAGKSTLLRLCNRLEVPGRGCVRYRGTDLAAVDPIGLRRRVGMVFQRPTPFPGTAADNLRVADPDLDAAAAVALLARARLGPAFLDRAATELSGGEAQRLCLARTLATRPEVLLMDEPTSSLDAEARDGLEDLARELAAHGVPVLWVTHDLAQVARLADHVLVVLDGRVAHQAPHRALRDGAPPAVLRFLEGGRAG